VLSTTSTDVDCNGGNTGSATASATGGTAPYTYAWDNGSTGATASGLIAGTYTVTITDANGCTETATATVGEPTALAASATATDANCNGSNDGSAMASASGGTSPYTYSWSNGSTGATASGLTAGTYTVTITDANGCSTSASATVNEPGAIEIQGAVTNATCSGSTDGSILVSVNDGTAPYTYAWSNGATTATISGLGAGFYDVTVTDANGCIKTQSYTVTENDVLIPLVDDGMIYCYGDDDGELFASATGGTPPYTYSWSNGATGNFIYSLAPGQYSVTVTDVNGCFATTTATVVDATPLVIDLTVINATCGMDNGSASVTVTGGVAPYYYYYSNGETTPSIINQFGDRGQLSITVEDYNGCSVTQVFEIIDEVPNLDCEILPGMFRTQTVGGWGATPLGANAGAYMHNNFSAAFPAGLTVGCGNTVTFTTAQEITDYLPCLGASGILSQSYTDPLCLNNSLVSQLVALTLSVEFDWYDPIFGISNTNLGELVVSTGPMNTLTVEQVLFEANNALGGCGSGFTLDQITQTLTEINQNFIDGTMADAYLECPSPCGGPVDPFFTGGGGTNTYNSSIAAWPNPSSEKSVNVEVFVEVGGQGTVNIYDAFGQRMTLAQDQGYVGPGRYVYTWDGTNRGVEPVLPGVYLIEVRVGDQIESVKIIRQ